MKKINISTNIAWALVIFGGIVECFWVIGLKYSDSFLSYCATALGIIISFACTILAMKKIDVSICYSAFVGIGTALVVIAQMIFFHSEFSLAKILLIACLLVGVIGLKIVDSKGC